MTTLKVRKVGNSIGVTFSKEVASRLRVEIGDELHLVEGPDGYMLTPYDPEFEKQMEVARSAMKKYKNALRELAR